MLSGYFRDSETQLDYAKNRYHQPGMGRFHLTVDPHMDGAKPNSLRKLESLCVRVWRSRQWARSKWPVYDRHP